MPKWNFSVFSSDRKEQIFEIVFCEKIIYLNYLSEKKVFLISICHGKNWFLLSFFMKRPCNFNFYPKRKLFWSRYSTERIDFRFFSLRKDHVILIFIRKESISGLDIPRKELIFAGFSLRKNHVILIFFPKRKHFWSRYHTKRINFRRFFFTKRWYILTYYPKRKHFWSRYHTKKIIFRHLLSMKRWNIFTLFPKIKPFLS